VPCSPWQLHNLLDNDGLPCYTQTAGNKYITYQHATAGAAIPKPMHQSITQWQQLRIKMKECHWNQWGIWRTEHEWQDVQWFATAKLLQAKLDELLATKRVSQQGHA
jgi:hypothetical protein